MRQSKKSRVKEIKAKIKKLLDASEKSKKKAKELEASLPKGEKEKALKQLKKEFDILCDGVEIEWHPKVHLEPLTFLTTIRWEEGDEAYAQENIEYVLDRAFDDYQRDLYEAWDEDFKNHPELIKMNKKIKDFIKRCDAAAAELGEDKNAFFDQMMNYRK
jgi:hypothetical protein